MLQPDCWLLPESGNDSIYFDRTWWKDEKATWRKLEHSPPELCILMPLKKTRKNNMMHLAALLKQLDFPPVFFQYCCHSKSCKHYQSSLKNQVPNDALAAISLPLSPSRQTNGSFIQNFKVTRSEKRTLTGPECSDTSVRLLQRRGRKRRRELDAVQRCQTSRQQLFWEKEHIPLRWLPLLLSLRRQNCDTVWAARSFLSHSKLLKLFLVALSAKMLQGNLRKFSHFSQKALSSF